MIRKATTQDICQIEELWRTSFNDPEPFVKSFLATIGNPDRALVYVEDGVIASMLFVLPGEIIANGVMRQMYYIYACATFPDYRGQGFMEALITEVYLMAKRDSVFALTLIPSNEALSLYYEKMGFKKLFKAPLFCSDFSDRKDALPFQSASFEKMVEYRRKYLTAELSVHWPKEHLRFALSDALNRRGEIQFYEDGYAVFEQKLDHCPVEHIPFEDVVEEWDEDYAMICFCEEYEVKSNVVPYFNFGLD